MRLLTSVILTTSNSFWSNTRINVSQKRNVMKFRTGPLYTQKMAHLYGRATSSSCVLCHQPDSQIHMLSGCQNASIQNMVTERHNIASRLIIKTPMASTKPFSRRTSILLKAKCYLHTTSWNELRLKNGHQRDIQGAHPSRWDVHLIEVKFCDDIRPEQQLARAAEQHNGLKHALAQQCHTVSLHTILIGVMGTIYKRHTKLPLSKLGLDR